MPRGHHAAHRGVPTPEGGARRHRVTVRFNDSEKTRVDYAAELAGETTAVYLRDAGLDCAKATITGDNGEKPTTNDKE